MKLLARGLAPLLGALAIAVFAAGGPAGDAAAEGLFLARLAAGLLAAIAFVAPQPWEGALASVLVVAAAWVLPAGPPRATTVVALLAGGLALAAWESLRTHAREETRAPDDARASNQLIRAAVPCAIGLQLLLRSDLLLGSPSASTAFTLLALPLAGGAATAWLATRHGARAGIAAAAVLAVGPGWNLTTTVTLIALAAASFLVRSTAVAGRLLAGLALVAPIAFSWRAGMLVLAAALSLFLSERTRNGTLGDEKRPSALWALLPALAVLALQLAPPLRAHAPSAALILLPLLPAAVLAAFTGNSIALAAGCLAVAGAGMLGGTAALAPAVGLAALARLAVPGRERVSSAAAIENATLRAQGTWSAVLLGATALAAAYPWLRPEPLSTVLNAIGIDVQPGAWRWLALPAVVLALGLALAGPRPRRLAAWGAAAMVLVLGAIVVHRAERRTPLIAAEIVLDARAAEQRLVAPPNGASGRGLLIDSALLDGAELAAGTPVAELAVERAGAVAEHFVLHAGDETGEWAARRGDLRSAGLAPAPGAWISWVAGTTPPIFGQRYRARFALAGSGALGAVTVRRAPSLPESTRLVIYGLEIVE